jgi:hypothetical protein
VIGQDEGMRQGVYGSGSIGMYASGSGYDSYGVYATASGDDSTGIAAACSGIGCLAGYFGGNVYVNGEIYVNSCSGCSDIRLKKNVEPLQGALDRLLQLKGVTFEWKDPSLHEAEAGHGVGTQTGFIAQDVERAFPNWVKEDGYKAKDGTTYRTLDLRQIEALEVESIRELKVYNDDLRSRLEANQERTAKLEERLDALQNGREPITGGVGVGRGTFLLVGLGLAGAFGLSRRRRTEPKAS